MFNHKAFTLVEILVVVGIIAILGVLSAVYYGKAQEKARIARAIAFEASLDRNFRDALFGEWTFEDGTVLDSSGYGSNPILNGAAVVTGSPCMFGQCLVLVNETDTAVNTLTNIPSFSTNRMTMMAWVYDTVLPTLGEKRIFNFSVSTDPSEWDGMYYNGFAKKFGGVFTMTNDNAYAIHGDALEKGIWHHIAVVYDEGERATYLDGKLVSMWTDGLNLKDGRQIEIMILGGGGAANSFTGHIDNVRLYADGPDL